MPPLPSPSLALRSLLYLSLLPSLGVSTISFQYLGIMHQPSFREWVGGAKCTG